MKLTGNKIELRTISDTKDEGIISFDENDTLERKINVKKNFSQVYQLDQLFKILDFSELLTGKMIKMNFTENHNSPMI